ncbi:ACP S-malonyltransferase [Clostridium estertheticum]|uniref:ACP S-malonyltransferase n=1 Tax=Clostridium estertheticum TaxID=238834 RepID=UPI0013EE7F14|nr:ACP S-malonyltransferase [Clostridium estertheticum]MBZ9609911.1 ACP S-malonyltransferase [Clostridium estertheticum]
MYTCVFPGQGSQQLGMGGDLFDKYADLTEQADRILGYSIKQLCLEDNNKQLNQTQYTQVALFMVNALSYHEQLSSTKEKPSFLIGHSLGEYNALYAAGVIDFETGIKLVKKRGELMSQSISGGMAAVLGMTEEEVRSVIKTNNLCDIYISNFNTPTQIILSGTKQAINNAKSYFEEAEVSDYVVLNVSGAFHSPFMEEAKNKFANYTNNFKFLKMQIPVISNVYAKPYDQEQLVDTLVNQIVSPVRWTESIHYLLDRGITEIIQVGPGDVITGLIRTIKREYVPKEKKIVESLNLKKQEEENTEKSSYKLGSKEFMKEYGLKYPYVIGGMYKGISSADMVIKAGKAGILGFYGAGGQDIGTIESNIQKIKQNLNHNEPFGINFLHNLNSKIEEEIVELLLKYDVRTVEASAFINITPALALYKIKGLKKEQGKIVSTNRVIAKLSRPEVAETFLSPLNENVINALLSNHRITNEEAEMAKQVPVADEFCAEADSGGHTDHSVAYTLIPTMVRLRGRMKEKYGYSYQIRIGAGGGIGTPEAAAAAFIMGADFIVTGSINQCTVEADTSDSVKELLQKMNIQDTDYAPSGDMFELGSKVQVLKRGLFFPVRANKLYYLYLNYNSIEEIDEATKSQIQNKYFKKTFTEVYEDVKKYYRQEEIDKAEASSKYKMGLLFKWYFGYATRLALSGDKDKVVDYQIFCGPALGAFNQWVKGSEYENWSNRHVDTIAKMLMDETEKYALSSLRSLISL